MSERERAQGARESAQGERAQGARWERVGANKHKVRGGSKGGQLKLSGHLVSARARGTQLGTRPRIQEDRRVDSCVPGRTALYLDKQKGEGHRSSCRVETGVQGDTSSAPVALDWGLEQRFLRLKEKVEREDFGVALSASKATEDSVPSSKNKRKKTFFKVSWADQKGVATLVNGFGRYLRGDNDSVNMRDLIGFHCQIAVDDPADIPENLAITLGDIIVNVTVIMERTAPFGGDDRGIPLAGGDQNEGGDQTDPLGRRLARRVNLQDGDGTHNNSNEGEDTGHSSTWNSSELRDRWRNSSPCTPDGRQLRRSSDDILVRIGESEKNSCPTSSRTAVRQGFAITQRSNDHHLVRRSKDQSGFFSNALSRTSDSRLALRGNAFGDVLVKGSSEEFGKSPPAISCEDLGVRSPREGCHTRHFLSLFPTRTTKLPEGYSWGLGGQPSVWVTSQRPRSSKWASSVPTDPRASRLGLSFVPTELWASGETYDGLSPPNFCEPKPHVQILDPFLIIWAYLLCWTVGLDVFEFYCQIWCSQGISLLMVLGRHLSHAQASALQRKSP
uniref:Uncharacterized protein n=1 Tax=Ananas comosus var. bracteatus TaxID=296719 RepID=A0A6V7PTC2_ANACO|nr:unnamed protein product [Ananas comosus var. bracteatus]